MKKLLFIAILFFSSLASAGFLQMQEQIIMSKQTACVDCRNQGGAEFHIDFDHSTSNVTACTSGDATGALTTATISTAQNHTSGACDGADDESLLKTDHAGNLKFDIASADIFDSHHGYLDMWVYVGASAYTDTIFEARYDADNFMFVRMYGGTSNRLYARHYSGGANDIVVDSATCALTDSAWNNVIVKWGDGADYDGAGAELAISPDGGSTWCYTATKNTLAAFATEPPNFELGCETYCVTDHELDDIFIDDVSLYTTNDGS